MVSQKWGCKNLFAVLEVNRTWNYAIQYKMLWIELMCASNTHTFLEWCRNSFVFTFPLQMTQTNIHNQVPYICRTIGEKVGLDWIVLSNTTMFFQLINLHLTQCAFQRTAGLYANQTTTYHSTFLSKIVGKKFAQELFIVHVFLLHPHHWDVYLLSWSEYAIDTHFPFNNKRNEMKIQSIPTSLFSPVLNSRAIFHSINGQFEHCVLKTSSWLRIFWKIKLNNRTCAVDALIMALLTDIK